MRRLISTALTIPALVFPRMAYGAQPWRVPETKWRVAGWFYAASLYATASQWALTEFGILNRFDRYWC